MSKLNYWMISNTIANKKRLNFPSFDLLMKMQDKVKSFYGLNVLNEHYDEIPLWIAKAHAIMRRANPFLTPSVRVFDGNLNTPILVESNSINIFSVMNSNAEDISKFTMSMPTDVKIWIGGYDIALFKSLVKHDFVHSYTYFDDMEAFATKLLSVEEDAKIKDFINPNFSLFTGVKVIPRIALSQGCYNNCSFCLIPKCVPFEEYSYDNVISQIEALRELWFEYVYIDDKTFGQASNHVWLKGLAIKLKDINPNFKGFIIQTTIPLLNSKAFIKKLIESKVLFVEVGIESYNNNILSYMNKGFTIDKIDNVMINMRNTPIKVIPNIIIGHPSETLISYFNTTEFIAKYGFDLINFFLYTDYSNGESEIDYDRVLTTDHILFVDLLLYTFAKKFPNYFSLNQQNKLIL